MTDQLAGLDAFTVPVGADPTDEHFRRLTAMVQRGQRFNGGRGVRHRVLPNIGTITHFQGSGGFGVSAIFRPEVSAEGGGFDVRWALGFIAGRKPTIDDIEIDQIDEQTGQTPALRVTDDDFNALGQCFIYFRVTVDDSGAIQAIEPVASATELRDNRLHGYKLALLLDPTGTVWRALHANQTYTAAIHRAHGGITHLFAADL